MDVRTAQTAQEIDAALALRRAVFVDEQGVSLEDELDGLDAQATHVIAVRDGAVVATCRLLREDATIKLGRVAVAAAARRQGIATRLLEESERIARASGSQQIVLHAQTDATALYADAGFAETGDVFMDAGIEHITMEKAL
jgi:predicted GNAT family N-acyltransferase